MVDVGAAAGLVLAGGRSSRMGAPKANLEWHGSTLLYHVTSLLRRTLAGPVTVVGAPGRPLPALPDGVDVVEDPVEGLGPLQGMAAGLASLTGRAEVAFVCSTDLPFLHPAFVTRVLRGFAPPGADGGGDDIDVVLPVTRGFRQPLAAAYRTGLSRLLTELVRTGVGRPGILFEHCRVTRLDDAALLSDAAVARHDPDLESVTNVNTRDDYRAARARPAPEIVVERLGTVRAFTLGEAADAIGLRLEPTIAVALNGARVGQDPRLPLVAGDTVAFLAPDAGR